MGDILTSKKGYVYTNGETSSNIIRLGVNDKSENWREITDEQAKTLQEYAESISENEVE